MSDNAPASLTSSARRRHLGLVLAAAIGVAACAAAAAWIGEHHWLLPVSPSCGKLAPGVASGCIAEVRVPLAVRRHGPIALSPAGDVLVLTGESRSDGGRSILLGLRVEDGAEQWRVVLLDPADAVSLSVQGDKVAVWRPLDESLPIRVMAVPSGRMLAEIVTRSPYHPPYYDVSFNETGDAVLFGSRSARGQVRLAAPGTFEPAPGFESSADCAGPMVGQSNIAAVVSRDNRIAAFLMASVTAHFQADRLLSTESLQQAICGSKAVILLPPPAWHGGEGQEAFAAFSPHNDRLALVYSTRGDTNEVGGLIEVRDLSATPTATYGADADIIGSFPILQGAVGYNIGWSADNRHLAVVVETRDGVVARIYQLP